MEGPRIPRADEFPQFIQFLSSQLRQGANWSIQDEYPLALTPANLPGMHFIEDGGKYVSGAVLKSTLVKSPAGLFKVAGIGSVVTDPAYRNQGHSKAVLESVLENAKRDACDIAILWTNLHDYYRKLDFEIGGSEIALRIDKPFSPPLGDLKFLESSKVAPEAISRLYAQHTCGTVRSVEEIRKCLTIPNMRVYTAWDSQNQLQAYAIEGKGADLDAHVHEWGGAVSKLLPLFSYIYSHQKRPITVMVPAHSKNLIRQMQQFGISTHEGVLGMIKLINPDLLYSKLRRYARNQGVEDFVIEQRAGTTHFGLGENLYKTDSPRDLIRMVFGPHKPMEIHTFDPQVGEVLNKLFPIPFWIWGWDSV